MGHQCHGGGSPPRDCPLLLWRCDPARVEGKCLWPATGICCDVRVGPPRPPIEHGPSFWRRGGGTHSCTSGAGKACERFCATRDGSRRASTVGHHRVGIYLDVGGAVEHIKCTETAPHLECAKERGRVGSFGYKGTGYL